MPGALLMSAAIFLYRLGLLELVGLSVAAAGHIVVDWGYLLASILSIPRHPLVTPDKGNPFLHSAIDPANAASTEGGRSNPLDPKV
jgi:hypothetical protein